jgi:hypothetical protein
MLCFFARNMALSQGRAGFPLWRIEDAGLVSQLSCYFYWVKKQCHPSVNFLQKRCVGDLDIRPDGLFIQQHILQHGDMSIKLAVECA